MTEVFLINWAKPKTVVVSGPDDGKVTVSCDEPLSDFKANARKIVAPFTDWTEYDYLCYWLGQTALRFLLERYARS